MEQGRGERGDALKEDLNKSEEDVRADLEACPWPFPRITLLSNQLERGAEGRGGKGRVGWMGGRLDGEANAENRRGRRGEGSAKGRGTYILIART